MRFNDTAYLENFYKNGAYPKIHDDIFYIGEFIKSDIAVIDLGCCFGLLAHRLATRHKKVIGVESNANYLKQAVKKENVAYVNLKITQSTLRQLSQLIKEEDIKAVYARRVIPEIYETGGGQLVSDLIKTFYDTGIEYIVIEGRKPTRTAVNPLKNMQQEIKACSKYYQPQKFFGECAVLHRI